MLVNASGSSILRGTNCFSGSRMAVEHLSYHADTSVQIAINEIEVLME